jgi:uncharacterized membrane protein
VPARWPEIAAPDHDVRAARLRELVRNGLWLIPGLFVAGAVALGLALRQVDQALVDGDRDLALLFDGDAGSAQALLAAIATSIMTFTSLVISVTVVALQLASQQFSPRVLRTFFRDTGTKVALGIFIGTFVYTLVVLRQVHAAGSGDAFVPRVSMAVAFGLALVSLAAFVYYVNHVVHSIRIVSIIDAVAAETRAAIREVQVRADNTPTASLPERPPDLLLTCEHAPGAIVTVDEDDLVELARRHRCTISLVPRMGQFVPSGAPLAEVWGENGAAPVGLGPRDVLAHIGLHRERTMQQDPAFGFRQLVDIAEKALSPAVNDPTTATQALDRIHDLLRRVALAPVPTGQQRDAEGFVRLVTRVATWEELVALACDEIRAYGGASHQVQRRMRAMLVDLTTVVGPEGRPALERQQRLLDIAAERLLPDPEDRRWALDPECSP